MQVEEKLAIIEQVMKMVEKLVCGKEIKLNVKKLKKLLNQQKVDKKDKSGIKKQNVMKEKNYVKKEEILENKLKKFQKNKELPIINLIAVK